VLKVEMLKFEALKFEAERTGFRAVRLSQLKLALQGTYTTFERIMPMPTIAT
jgi:hypothetical protein